jgi:Flp pilus assembly protein TadG
MTMRTHLRTLARRENGATAVEFALIAPALCVLLLGSFDVGHTLYMQGVLQGAVQKASRDGTLEQAAGNVATQRDAIDQLVRDQIGKLNSAGEVAITRRFYKTFASAAAAQAESFTDSGPGSDYRDDKCNNGESFVDANNNGRFDRDGGDSVERAGARDNVVYTVSISYPRMFPIDKFVGGHGTTTVTATTVLANQPYGDQTQYAAPTVGHCGIGVPGADAPE